jgi:hypothetical protein
VPRQPKKPLSVHVGLAIAEFICLSAFAIELSRAVSGNTLSWAYVFEWPILGGYAVYMWRNLGADDGSPSTPSEVDVDALQTYNEYLVRVHETTSDHPGAPPTN